MVSLDLMLFLRLPYGLDKEPKLFNSSVLHAGGNPTTMQTACSGDRVNIANKNQARENLLSTMKQLALHNESVATGNRAKQISSGFEIASDGDSTPALEQPKNFKLSEGKNPDEIVSSVEGVPNAISYMHEYSEDPVTPESTVYPRFLPCANILLQACEAD